ncbi:MAG: molybdopterin-dependent oxidoreductase [Deltaproteobacteria bacterium]|nr:molybdopterin-dependent oxidoreductase [Deltaproteobacteria bacterium]
MADRSYRACTLCEATCGIVVETERDRVRSIRGDDLDPFSRGYVCPKAHGLKGLQEDPDRVRRPLRRTASGWQEIPWPQALAEAAQNLQRVRGRHGAESLAIFLGNPAAHNLGSMVYGRVLIRALGSRQRYSATSVDQLPKMISSCLLFGEQLLVPVPDVDRTDYLMMIGANPAVSNGSLMTAPAMPKRLRALRERGGRLVVVDPRRSETARLASQHLPIRPGTDALFLFAIVRTLFEEGLVRLGRLEPMVDGLETVRALARGFAPEAVSGRVGIAAPAIRRVAREIAQAPTAACYGRIGTCTQEFGTLASWLVDVVNVLTGNLDRAGGAMFTTPAASFQYGDTSRKSRGIPYGRWKSRVRGLPEFGGELPAVALAEEIDTPGEGQVHGLVTVSGNPVLSTPHGARLARALDSLDYMVAIDFYVNETTRHADLILPTTAPLEHEHYDLLLYNLAIRNVAKYSPATIAAAPDAKHDWEILLALAAPLMGLPSDVRALDDRLLAEMVSRAVGRPGTPAASVDPQAALAQLGAEPGPARVLDLLLRTGRYGDGFDDARDGLSLRRLRAAEHGLDLGPLEPRLPQALATPSGKIELAHDLLVADVDRLRAAVGRPSDGLVLVGRRQLRSNNSWMHNVAALVKGPERCTLLVHPADARRLGIADGGRARVSSRVGSVEAPVTVSDEIMPGVVSLPHGWGHGLEGVRLRVAAAHPGVPSNFLADPDSLDALSGNAVLNGIPVTVEPA